MVAALLHDRDRYVRENPPIPAPNAIVVSGDLVSGVALNTSDAEEILRQQYDEARELILKLTDKFLDSNLSYVSVVPGNHDVSWNVSRAAMVPVDAHDLPQDIKEALSVPGSYYRWSWRDLRLYRIHDRPLYDARMDAYWKFISQLYGSLPLTRVPSRDAGYGLFEVDAGHICVAAYNSCLENDCFSFRGEISRQVIAKSILEMRQRNLGPGLRMGVWHHNTEGPPSTSDYMDIDIVRQMMSGGIRLGLHGHQHHAQVAPQYVRLPDRQTMVLVSAGSLCAGHRDLPVGHNRQYNIVIINEDRLSARVHIRGRTVGNMFGALQLQELGGLSYSDVSWDRVQPESGGHATLKSRTEAIVLEAEEQFQRNQYKSVIELLEPLKDRLDLLGRNLLIRAALESEKWENAAKYSNPPLSIQEATWAVEAFVRIPDFHAARLVVSHAVERLQLTTPQASELYAYISAKEALR